MKNFIPYGRQYVSKEDIQSVTDVLKSDFLTQGPTVPKFEKLISEKVNSKYAVAANSATSALHLACLALELNTNDFLWTTPITFVASANCSQYCNAKIDFVDIDQDTGLMSVIELEKKLKIAAKEKKLPKIIVPVHLAGSSCDMKKIFSLSQKYGFKIIEDASHAIGGKYYDENVGSCKYSSICIFSFHPVKIITSGEGGIATTNDYKIAESMRIFRSHGITKDPKDFLNEKEGDWYYEQQRLGYNYRLTDIAAALGISQLKRLEEIVEERNKLLKNYERLIKGQPISLLKIPNNVFSSVHLAVIKLDVPDKEMHKHLFNCLRGKGIGVQLHYFPVHLQPYFKNLGFKLGDFPESEIYKNNAISIPLYPGLQYETQKRIVKIIKDFIKEFKNA